jgi:two-component system OmpR family sensor kinase
VQVSVVDHGEGIPEALQEKVFDRFYRADNSRNRETGGSGLGLAIARSIVNAHKGKIWVETTSGGGATFSFELPLAR